MRIVSDLNYCAWLRATRPDGHRDPQYIASVIDQGLVHRLIDLAIHLEQGGHVVPE
jgi:hypothetical protein